MSITHSRVMFMFLFPLSPPAYILNVKPFFPCLIKTEGLFCLRWKCCWGRTSTYVRVANANGAVKKQISLKKYFLVMKISFATKSEVEQHLESDLFWQQTRDSLLLMALKRLQPDWHRQRHVGDVTVGGVKPKKNRIFTVSNSDSRNWESRVKDVRH